MENQLIDANVLEIDPDAPDEILVQLSLLPPVAWEAVDADGRKLCERLRLRMVIGKDEDALKIECRFVRHVEEAQASIFPTYVLAFAPALIGEEDDPNRFLHEDGFRTIVHEAALCGRAWTTDVHRLELFWDHRRESVETVANRGYREAPKAALPPLTGQEASLEDLFAGIDADFAAIDGQAPPTVEEDEDPGIELTEQDVEIILEQIRPETTERLKAYASVPPPVPIRRRALRESFGYDVFELHGREFTETFPYEPVEEFDLDEALKRSA